jgi:hypothetical protein
MQGAATDAQEDVTAGARREEWSSTQRRAFRVSCTLGASPENVISSAVRALRSVIQSFRMLVPTELMPTIIWEAEAATNAQMHRCDVSAS